MCRNTDQNLYALLLQTRENLPRMVTYTGSAVLSRSMPDRHMMVDIETCAIDPRAAIVAIGAVVFDPRGEELGKQWATTISIASNTIINRLVDPLTMQWWEQQDQEAQDATFKGPQLDIRHALTEFTGWINRLRPTCTRIWAKDPDFDVATLQNACKQLNIVWPFKFWEARSCRTAMEMAYPMGDFPQMLMDGPKHDALADARVQALEIQHSFFVLGC